MADHTIPGVVFFFFGQRLRDASLEQVDAGSSVVMFPAWEAYNGADPEARKGTRSGDTLRRTSR